MVLDKQNYGYAESRTQERMMRVGIETAHIKSPTNEEIYRIAVETLKDDDKRKKSKKDIHLTNDIIIDKINDIKDLEKLFIKQIDPSLKLNLYYYLAVINKRLSVVSCTSLNEIFGKYKSGYLQYPLGIPQLER